MAAPTKLILDVDTGTDDAIALMVAALHPDIELVAATTVNGNNPVAYCTDNTLRVFDLLGVPIPVHEGAASPLIRDDFPIPRAVLHAEGSMHGLELPIPKPRSVKHPSDAVEFLIETYLAATEEIVLMPVGPLTNIALAIRREPRIVERIPRLIVMGGAHEAGNTTASAEFNIWADPEAAQVVFRAGLRDVTLIPLDATHRALVSAADCARLRGLGYACLDGCRHDHRGADRRLRRTAADGDRPLGTGPRCPVRRVSGRPGRRHRSPRPRRHRDERRADGRADRHGHARTLRARPNAFVAFDANGPRFVELLLDVLARS